MSNTDFDDLRNLDDDFDNDFDDFGDEDVFAAEEAAAERSGGLGLSPVEQIILAVFVLLNVLALLVIILIVAGVWRL